MDNLDLLDIYIDYYSYLEGGEKKICVHYYDCEYCKDAPFAVLCNGGVAMFHMNAFEFGIFAVSCAKKQIIIDTKNIH